MSGFLHALFYREHHPVHSYRAGNWYPPVKAEKPPTQYDLLASNLALLKVDLDKYNKTMFNLLKKLDSVL